uniref:NADH dehydrogenase subunit 5 n=1 Tax=Telenomus remus TaxID=1569972 RepID=UPI001E281B2E|nr:NADH dehydrogenase subunit 5 [Telenomus remus]QTE20726.1 NADH dehydrogenase subunit 5 [Telenomus remus]
MLIYLNLGILMLMFSFFFMFMLLKFLILKLKIFIEFELMKIFGLNFSVLLYFDYKTLMFIMLVLMISSMIIFYSIEYMWMDMFSIRFIYILMLFVFSMLLMIVGQNLLMILLGWDGLGLISYCLVIYYNSWSSYFSGMLTILTNRLGDIGLLLSISMMSMYGDWNYMLMNFKFVNFFMIFFLMLGAFTKSAQVPFSSWLPMAMAAPTPISSLVHSSTLVTAGVYLMIRLKNLMFLNMNFKFFMLFLSLMTMFFSGMVASFENDFKKIIALSTLSQLGIMMLTLLLGFSMLSFFHLVIHAMFKSLLFMCAGLILHSMNNNQDVRYLGGMSKMLLLTLIYFHCSNLALCGFPFLSGFYSKDMILELSIFNNLNILILLMFYISLSFTVIYTFRLIYYSIFNLMMFNSSWMCYDSVLMNFSMTMMFIYSVLGGSLFSWFVFDSLMLIILENSLKYFLNILIFLSMLVGLFIFILNKIISKKILLFNFMKFMWFMNNFSSFFSKNFLFFGNKLFLEMDKGWFEKISKDMIFMIYINFMKLENFIMMLMVSIFFFFFFMIIFYF